MCRPRLAAAGKLSKTATNAAEAKKEGWWSLIGLCALLSLTRLPFFWTGHVQEDAYISFRTGFNLADHGALTFNLGEHYAATTSLLYGYLIAAVRLLAGPLAIPVILGLNALAASSAIILIARSFQLHGRCLWAFGLLAGLTSGALVASFNGMETSWYLLFIATLMWCLGHPRDARWLLFSLIAISPLVRPDGLVLAIAAVGLQWLYGSAEIRRDARWNVITLVVAMALYVALNLAVSHSWATPSIIAKQATYHPDVSIKAIAARFATIYFGGSLSLIPATKYVPWQLTLGISLLSFMCLAIGFVRLRSRLRRPQFVEFSYLGVVSLAFPLFFVVGGGMFPWYYLPSEFALSSSLLVAVFVLTSGKSRLYSLMLVCPLIIGAAALQFVLSLNTGRQEAGYRASVGRYLALVSKPGDTLILEPAGYIPFYSGLVTYDEVGLTSPRVLTYLRSHKRNWIADFIHDTCPTFTVQRGDFSQEFLTGTGYRFNAAEQRWFSDHYEIARHFHYTPSEWARNAVELQILRFGSHSDYFVYRRRESVECSATTTGS